MDQSMNYELVIRRAYKCARGGVKGADADIFRRYERALRIYFLCKKAKEKGEIPPRKDSLMDLEYDSNVHAGEIVSNLDDALDQVYKRYGPRLTSGQSEQIKNCRILLQDRTYKSIVTCMENANKLMSELKLIAG